MVLVNTQLPKWLRIAFLLFAIFVILWSSAWLIAAYVSNHLTQQWIEKEQIQGRIWSCNDRSVRGFPLNFVMVCTDANVLWIKQNERQSLSISRITADYSLLSPRKIDISLSGPIRFVDTRNSDTLTISSTSLVVQVMYSSLSAPQATIDGRNVLVRLDSSLDTPLFATDKIVLNLEVVHRGQHYVTLVGNLNATQILSSRLDEFAANSHSASVDITFELKSFHHLLTGSGASRFQTWHRNGGELSINSLRAKKGDLALEAQGQLSLDQLNRATGQLSLRAAGLTSVLKRLGLPLLLPQRDNLLKDFLRRSDKTDQESASSRTRFVPIPMTLRDGRVWIGPIRTPLVLTPLF